MTTSYFRASVPQNPHLWLGRLLALCSAEKGLGVGDHLGWDRISEESPEWPNTEMRTTNRLEARVVAPLHIPAACAHPLP
jgi:hypothetical protein